MDGILQENERNQRQKSARSISSRDKKGGRFKGGGVSSKTGPITRCGGQEIYILYFPRQMAQFRKAGCGDSVRQSHNKMLFIH